MAASSSADAREGSLAERLHFVRPLGARAVPSWAAIETLGDNRKRLVVVDKIRRGGEHGDQVIADWVRDARRMATLDHPHLARVRDVAILGDEVLVSSDYLDGVLWSELATRDPRPSLEIALRVLVDVLTGLSAMHNLRDAKREPLKLVHGEVTPEYVVVGLDGMSRIVSPCRLRGEMARGPSSNAYLAPEILLGDESADARADVYGVGVMLWEALTGQRLFPNLQASAIVTNLLSGRVPPPTVPAASPWGAPLVEVATRAMSADPGKRFASAAALAAEIRRIAGTKLVPAVRVAGTVRGAYGDRIRARRDELERGESRAPSDGAIDVDVDARITDPPVPATTATTTTRPPPLLEHTAPVPSLPKPPPVPTRIRPAAAASPPQPIALVAPGLPSLVDPADTASESAGTPSEPLALDVVALLSAPRPPPPPVQVKAPMVEPVREFPPAMAPMHVPLAGRVPDDLVDGAAAEAAAAIDPPGQRSPFPNVPPMVTPLAVEQSRPAWRGARVALVAGPVALAALLLGLGAWWLASRAPEQRADTAAPPPSVPSATVAAVAPVDPPSSLPPEPALPTPSALSPPAMSETAMAAAVDLPPSPSAVTAPPPPTPPAFATPAIAPPPVAPPRPALKRKYEPAGI